MKTAIIAAAKGYTVNDIKPWMESLKKSGFAGEKFIILYEPINELADYFKENDFNVLIGQDDSLTHIATQRFRDYANLLSSDHGKDIDFVIHTDIRDVIFQADPEKWLKDNIGRYHIISSGEGVSYRHEDWNGDGLQTHYGKEMFDEMIDEETLCSGIIAGRKEAFVKLCQTIYELAFFSNDPGGFADQHFYNVAIRKSFSEVSKISSADESWTLNCGTMVAIPNNSPEWSSGPRTSYNSYERFRKGSYLENMLVGLPTMKNGIAYNPSGAAYAIVHQYDRYVPWKKDIYAGLKLEVEIDERPLYGTVYRSNLLDKLKVKFPGVEDIKRNTSQSYQDMFVLASTDGKRNGTFLEIGAQHAQFCSNTYILEKNYGWTGVSIDIESTYEKSYTDYDRTTNFVLADALSINYSELLSHYQMPSHIDYLQLDIDPAKNTFDCLMKIPFEKYTFSVITFETDFYNRKDTDEETALKIREESRKYLQSKGYVLAAGNVCCTNKDEIYEDWYINPSYVNVEKLKDLIVGDFNDTAETLMLK
jgi:hypothetical protein